MSIKTSPKDQIIKGAIYACIAFFSFTIMQALNKLMSGHHHVVEIAFWRNLLALIPCAIYALVSGQTRLFKTTMPGTLAVRVVVGTVGLMLTFAATQALPIANATVIFFTSTLLIPVLAHFFLKEHIGWHRWVAIFIGLSGVIIVAKPSAAFTVIGVALALAAASSHAIIQVAIRAMRTENPFTITLYFFIGGVIIPGLVLPFFWNTPTWQTIPYLVGVAVSGGLGQYFLTRGFQMAPASMLGPLNYTGLIWATILDILIWKTIPTWPVFAGGAIIISSNFYIIYREQKSQAQ